MQRDRTRASTSSSRARPSERHATIRSSQRIAAAYVAKYGSVWRFEVRDGAFAHGGNTALVFEVAPVKAFGFAKGTFGQTRWRF